MKRCNRFLGMEKIADGEFQPYYCLLPKGHSGPCADWTAWLGVPHPDFTTPGVSCKGQKPQGCPS